MGIPIPDKPDILVVPVEVEGNPALTRLTARIDVQNASVQIPDYNDKTYVCPHFSIFETTPGYIAIDRFKSIMEYCTPEYAVVLPSLDLVIVVIRENESTVMNVCFKTVVDARLSNAPTLPDHLRA